MAKLRPDWSYTIHSLELLDERDWPDRLISSVEIETSQESIDVSTFDSPYLQMPGLRRIDVKDQDGVEVPTELREVILDVVLEKNGNQLDVERVIKRWNTKNGHQVSESYVEHPWPCLYAGDTRWPCVCQRTWLFDNHWNLDLVYGPLLWHCECCEEPWSSEKHELCDLCEAHEYSVDVLQQSTEHASRLI